MNIFCQDCNRPDYCFNFGICRRLSEIASYSVHMCHGGAGKYGNECIYLHLFIGELDSKFYIWGTG